MTDSSLAPPSYAPVSTTSYTPSSHLYSQEEITRTSLIKSPLHKNVYESLAEVYSIITALEVLENSFIKDYITDKEKYTSTTLRLLNQYQMLFKGLCDDSRKYDILNNMLNQKLLNDLSNFLPLFTEKYSLDSPLASKRIETGVPATIEHFHTHVSSSSHHMESNSSLATAPTSGGNTNNKSARLIAETTGNFITCMDALKLNYRTKEHLHPLLSELVVSLNDLVNNDDNEKGIEFQGKSKLVNWLIKLNNFQDNQELTSEEIEAFLNDLDYAYKNFYVSLE